MAQCTKSIYSVMHEQYAVCTLFKHQSTLRALGGLYCVVYFQAHPSGHSISPLHTSSLLNQVHSAPPLLPPRPIFTFSSIISLLHHDFSLFFNHCPFSPSSPALVFLNIPPWIVSFDPFFLTSLLNIPLHNVCFSSPFSSNFLVLFPLGWIESIQWTRPEKGVNFSTNKFLPQKIITKKPCNTMLA